MPVTFIAELEDINEYVGKNGYGANLSVSKRLNNRVKRLEFNTNSQVLVERLQGYLLKQIKFTVELNQNRWGLTIGNLLGFEEPDEDEILESEIA